MTEQKSRTVRVILNGQKADNDSFREAVEALREQENLRLEVRPTWEPGDAERFAREAVEQDVDVVAAGGGDGTVNAVVHGLMAATDAADDGPALAVIPMGTANDFAVGCGIPVDDLAGALRLAATGTAYPVDICRINDNCFINAAAAGLGAQITSETPVALKKLMGGAAYAVMGILRLPEIEPFSVRIHVGGLENDFDILLITIGNGRNTAGGQIIAPEAALDDGLMDVMIVHEAKPASWLDMLDEYDNLGRDECEFVRYQQIESFTIEFDDEVQMNLDGEPIRGRAFEIEVLPQRLSVVLPDDCPLLSKNQTDPTGDRVESGEAASD